MWKHFVNVYGMGAYEIANEMKTMTMWPGALTKIPPTASNQIDRELQGRIKINGKFKQNRT